VRRKDGVVVWVIQRLMTFGISLGAFVNMKICFPTSYTSFKSRRALSRFLMTLRKNANLQARQYDVLADGVVVGRIMKAKAAPVDAPWMWTLIFGYHEDRTPTHGCHARGGNGQCRGPRESCSAPRPASTTPGSEFSRGRAVNGRLGIRRARSRHRSLLTRRATLVGIL
jgi:hypothetical protein